GQLCCGANEILTVQLCCGPSEKGDPGDVAQLSCSVKLGRPSKSLTGKFELPEASRNVNTRPLSVVPAGSVFVRVMLWVVGVVPSIWVGKVIDAGIKEMGCVQALLVVPTPKQMFPSSPGRFPPGHAFVVTEY